MNTTNEITPIVASKVALSDRLNFYPTFFGSRFMMRGEAYVMGYMDKFSDDYNGGDWEFYSLSNGGYYMAPNYDAPLFLEISDNWFSGQMTADAAGIVATLFALGQLAGESQGTTLGDRFITLYHLLRAFAKEHPESSLILSAID
ncbi:antirestriction protein [Vibrio diabolicus]|uniref:antirestriction protein n=1 Tax=Vibrio diabolicus TaxID=50719 RepID=UPI00193B3D86|nr:antirestriction protein [Vibrio diabolicus]EGQ8484949.1 antirestriction protein [Vibrio parahaemolyticus]HCH1696721.1 antirestriction protein [Vibrio parahaemolyticus]